MELDDAAFRALFSKSPVKRIGRDRFLRNGPYAIGNSRRPELRPAAMRRRDDAAPLVRGAAVWALSRLLPAPEFQALRRERRPGEADPEVAAEWDAELTARTSPNTYAQDLSS